MTLNQMLLDKWYSNNCKLSFLEMLFDEISFLQIHVYCFELVIKFETLELKEKMDASTHNKIVMNYHSGAYCDIALIRLWFSPWSSVFMTRFTSRFPVITSVSLHYEFICGMKLKIIFFGPWKCKVIFPEYWLSSPLSDGKVQVVCKNRERSFMGF